MLNVSSDDLWWMTYEPASQFRCDSKSLIISWLLGLDIMPMVDVPHVWEVVI